jgi:hypothetical protein
MARRRDPIHLPYPSYDAIRTSEMGSIVPLSVLVTLLESVSYRFGVFVCQAEHPSHV